VIDRSALEQAREGLGGRDIEEPLIGLEVQKSTLEWCETVVFLHHAMADMYMQMKIMIKAKS
jgi:hypothetical protein